MKNQTYLFFRDGTFYPLDLASDEEAIKNAKCNPGTLRVERTNGNVIWWQNDIPLELADAIASYLATDGSYRLYDATPMLLARGRLELLLGLDNILGIQKKIKDRDRS